MVMKEVSRSEEVTYFWALACTAPHRSFHSRSTKQEIVWGESYDRHSIDARLFVSSSDIAAALCMSIFSGQKDSH